MLYVAYAIAFLFSLLAAAWGIRLTFQVTPGFSERWPPLRWRIAICLVSAALVYPAMFVSHHLVASQGVLELPIGLGCAAVASALMTLGLMVLSR